MGGVDGGQRRRRSQTVAATPTQSDAGSHCPASRRLTAPPLIAPDAASDNVSVDSVANQFWLVKRPRLIFAIASEVWETQPREAVAKKAKMVAVRGRMLGSRSKHLLSASRHRPTGQGFSKGRFLTTAIPGTTYLGTRENG